MPSKGRDLTHEEQLRIHAVNSLAKIPDEDLMRLRMKMAKMLASETIWEIFAETKKDWEVVLEEIDHDRNRRELGPQGDRRKGI